MTARIDDIDWMQDGCMTLMNEPRINNYINGQMLARVDRRIVLAGFRWLRLVCSCLRLADWPVGLLANSTLAT